MYRLLALLLICIYAGCLCQAQAFPRVSSGDDLRLLQSAALQSALNGQLNRSISLQEKAVSLAVQQYGADSPAVADMYFHLGTLALEASEFQKAQDALSQSVQINPSSVAARVKLSEILRLRGHFEAARQQAAAAVSSHRSAPEARQELALCYLDLGSMSKANQQFFNLSQILSGRTPAVSDATASYSASVKPAEVPPSTSAQPAVVPMEHSVIRALTAHSRQPNLNTTNILNSASAATQAFIQKASKQLSIQMNAKARTHESHHSHSIPSRRHPHEAGSRAQQGSLVPPPPETTPSYPGVVPVESRPPHPSRSKPSPPPETNASDDNKDTQDNSQGTQADRGAAPAQNSDFLLDWASVKKKR